MQLVSRELNQPHIQNKKCVAALVPKVNRVRPKMTAGRYNRVVWLRLRFVVP